MTNKLLLLEKIKMVLKLMAPLLMTESNRKKISIPNNNKMDSNHKVDKMAKCKVGKVINNKEGKEIKCKADQEDKECKCKEEWEVKECKCKEDLEVKECQCKEDLEDKECKCKEVLEVKEIR
jgi:hypothetical protein